LTYTVARLPLSPASFNEIKTKLTKAGYEHTFMPGGEINMHEIAVEAEPVPTPTFDMIGVVADALGATLHDGMEFRISIGDGKRFVEALAARGYQIERTS
jgi:hypothetical protein